MCYIGNRACTIGKKKNKIFTSDITHEKGQKHTKKEWAEA